MKVYIKNNIVKYRKSKGLSQEELAKELKISRDTVGHLEAQSSNASAKLMYRICKYFGVSLENMFYIDNDIE